MGRRVDKAVDRQDQVAEEVLDGVKNWIMCILIALILMC